MRYQSELLSVRQISDELGISESTIWRWSKLGIMSSPIPVGRQRRWHRSVVDAIKSGAITTTSVESSSFPFSANAHPGISKKSGAGI